MNAISPFSIDETIETPVSKLVAAWERKLTKTSAKAAGLGLMAVSLAACGDSDSTETDSDTSGDTDTDTGGDTPTNHAATEFVVEGADIDGLPFDGTSDDGTTTIELAGNTDPDVDAGEWINYEALLIHQGNGDFTITDIQATGNDAADGAVGTILVLEDVGQTTAGTVTFDFDAQAVDQDDTVVNMSLDEVAGTLVLTGGAIETVNVTIDDGTNEASELANLQITGLTTLTISGGVVDQVFFVLDELDTTLTTLDASTFTGDLDLDVRGAGSATYTLGMGSDFLVMGNDLDSEDTLTGGEGIDLIHIRPTTADIRMPTMDDVEELAAVFNAAATIDATSITGLEAIGLGLDEDLNIEASTADADFNNLKAEVQELGIFATQQDVELDYVSGANANLTVAFENADGAITIGDGLGPDMQFLHVQTLTLNANTSNAVTVRSDIDVSDDLEGLFITTSMEGGDLILADRDGVGGAAGAVSGTANVSDLSIMAVNGDMLLGLPLVGGAGEFMQDAESLQTYRLSAEDADVSIGKIGDFGTNAAAASDFEILDIMMVDEATLNHDSIDASGANVSLFSVTASDKNTVIASGLTAPSMNAPTSVSVNMGAFIADQVDNQVLTAADGGHINLAAQSYTVNTQTYSGTGDITITATNINGSGYVQTEAADASNHSGLRTFLSGDGDDVFYGSTGDDEIFFAYTGASGAQTDVYLDSGGSDTLTHTTTTNLPSLSVYDDGSMSLTDSGTATDDDYTLIGMLGAGLNASTVFHAGGGNDTVDLSSGGIMVDFADYDSGVLHLENFTRNLGAIPNNDTMSFDGMMTAGGMFTLGSGNNQAVGINLNGNTSPINSLNSNAVYVVANGDAPSGGALAGASILDYENLTDVADYLDAITTASGDANDIAIFVVNNLTLGGSGDDHDAYVYVYADSGNGGGIDASEITLIATLDTNAALTANDIL